MRALLRRGVERYPLLWAALLAVSAVLAVDGVGRDPVIAWTGGVILAVLFLAILSSGRRILAVGALTCALVAAGFHLARLSHQRQALPIAMSSLEGVVRIATLPKVSGRGWSAMAVSENGARWWFRGLGSPPEIGETVQAAGRFDILPPTRNPGQFDFRDWLHRQGVSGVFESRGPWKPLAAPGWLDRTTSGLRRHFSDAITRGMDPLSPEAAVIRAMVLGEIPPDPQITEPFRTSGTLHAFSVSGMHVGMLAVIGWFILRLFGVRRRPAILLLISGITAYVWISGMSPPAVRSLTMAAIVLAGFLLRRRGSLANALGAALLAAVLFNGHLIFLPGVQLSFGVVASIAFASSWAMRPLHWITAMDPYLPRQLYSRLQRTGLWLRSWLASTLGMSLAATAGSLPLLIWHFGLVSPVAILASLIMGPLIFALMALAFLSASLSFLPPVSTAINYANRWVATACLGEAKWSSSLPGAYFQVPRDRPGRDFLVVYDPGNGGAASVLHDAGATVLFDTGHDFSFKNLVVPSLQHFALTPEALVLSHPDGGHIGGALAALQTYPIHQVLLPVEKARSPAFDPFLQEASARGIPHPLGQVGTQYPISATASLEVLSVASPSLANAAADERVMVFRLHWHGWRILFTSDAGQALESALLRSGQDLRSDVIVMGRHARDTSGSDAFLDAVQPRAIVAAHSDFPPEERIPERWLTACQARGIHVLHQGKTGAVLLNISDRDLHLKGYVDGQSIVLTR